MANDNNNISNNNNNDDNNAFYVNRKYIPKRQNKTWKRKCQICKKDGY